MNKYLNLEYDCVNFITEEKYHKVKKTNKNIF